MKLDHNVIEQLSNPINQVWQYIGGEVEEMVGDANDEALELCIDAGRLTTVANSPSADELVSQLIDEHGITQVFDFLNENIRLV